MIGPVLCDQTAESETPSLRHGGIGARATAYNNPTDRPNVEAFHCRCATSAPVCLKTPADQTHSSRTHFDRTPSDWTCNKTPTDPTPSERTPSDLCHRESGLSTHGGSTPPGDLTRILAMTRPPHAQALALCVSLSLSLSALLSSTPSPQEAPSLTRPWSERPCKRRPFV